MANRLLDIMKVPNKNTSMETGKEIAVIGLGLELPQANDAHSYWKQASEGISSIGELPYARKMEAESFARYRGMARSDWQFIRQGYLRRIDRFDYRFFGLSPREAELTDPHQRLFMQTAWHAFEDAGLTMEKLKGSRTGVFVGYDHEPYNYTGRVLEIDSSSYKEAHVGNLVSMIPGRVAYHFDLKGPSMIVNTSCSSSLAAVHAAVRAIRGGECDAALVGGIRLDVLPIDLIGKVGIESSRGQTRTFDDQADGTVTGEGVCAVVLKSLRQAVKDRDGIYAVIKGSAANQDGHSIGLTAPNALSQEEVIVAAWQDADISPDTIGYWEAHGTGTKLGDPIELGAINKAFARFTNRKQFCAISSAKPNIGHLIGAAGLAGFIRAAMAIHSKTLPPTLHFSRPNRNIPFVESAVYVNDVARPWPADAYPRRCGVSSFGFSGTNCHLVLEEAPDREPAEEPAEQGSLHALAVSAASVWSLRRNAQQLAKWLPQNTERIADVCYTASVRRSALPYRLLIVGSDANEIASLLSEVADDDWDLIEPGTGMILGAQPLEEGPLKELAAAFVAGAASEWTGLYSDERHRLARLPLYPFEPLRCWLDCPDTQPVYLWETGWELAGEDSDPLRAAESGSKVHAGETLIIHGGGPRAMKIADAMRGFISGEERLTECVYGSLTAGMVLSEDSQHPYPEQPEIEALLAAKVTDLPERIVFAYLPGDSEKTGGISEDRVMKGINEGFFRLLGLCRALTDKHSSMPELVVVTSSAYSVTGAETHVYPEAALLHSLGSSIPLEVPGLRILTFDIDEETPALRVVSEIIAASDHGRAPTKGANTEVAAERGAIPAAVTVLRNGRKYERVCKSVAITDGQSGHPFVSHGLAGEGGLPLREGGVYVITGGGGGIGGEIAAFIADSAPLHVALVTRLNPPDERTLSDIRSSGSTVSVHIADCSHRESLAPVLDAIRREYGPINGIFHCAGSLAAQGVLLRKAREIINQQMAGKVFGALLLDELTAEDPLDFFFCSSSISAHVGLPGELDYSLSNALLDAICEERSTRRPGTKCINWPAWLEKGMAVASGADLNGGVLQAVTNSDAMKALAAMLRSNLNKAIAGRPSREPERFAELVSGRLGMVDYYAGHEPAGRSSEPSEWRTGEGYDINAGRKPHIRLLGKEGLPSESEQLVAAAWAEVLGYSEFQIDDQFFDIGGNSILILKVHSLIERNRPGTVELPDLFAYPTIATLAGHIDAQLGRKAEDMEAGGAAAAATAAAAAAETEEDGDLELLIERLALGELSVSGAVSALTKGKAGERHE